MTREDIKSKFLVEYSEDGTLVLTESSLRMGIKPEDNREFLKLTDIPESGDEFFMSEGYWDIVRKFFNDRLTLQEWIERMSGPDYGGGSIPLAARRLKNKDDMVKVCGLKGVRRASVGELCPSMHLIAACVYSASMMRVGAWGGMVGERLNLENAWEIYLPDFGDMTGWRMLGPGFTLKEGDEYMVWHNARGYMWQPIYKPTMEGRTVNGMKSRNYLGFYARRKEGAESEQVKSTLDIIPEILQNMIREDSKNVTIRGMCRNLFHVILPKETMATGPDAVFEYILNNAKQLPARAGVDDGLQLEESFTRRNVNLTGNQPFKEAPMPRRVPFKLDMRMRGHDTWTRRDRWSGVMEVPENIFLRGTDAVHEYIGDHFSRDDEKYTVEEGEKSVQASDVTDSEQRNLEIGDMNIVNELSTIDDQFSDDPDDGGPDE